MTQLPHLQAHLLAVPPVGVPGGAAGHLPHWLGGEGHPTVRLGHEPVLLRGRDTLRYGPRRRRRDAQVLGR